MITLRLDGRTLRRNGLLVARTEGQRVVLEQVVEERAAQDRQWGGKNHDDNHQRSHWIGFLKEHLDRARRSVARDADEYRQQLVEIAALAVAALESHDRKFR